MQYDFNLLPNESQTMEIAGRFFKYKSGTGVIRVRTTGGGYVDLLPGQGVWNVEFSSLTVTDRSGSANAGVLVAGAFDFRDDRIVGQVEVINGERARTMADKAFVAYINVAPATGYAPYVQLWNPVNSGKNLIVERLYLCSATTQSIRIGVTAQLPIVVGAPQNKRIGSAAVSVAEARVAITNAPAIGTAIYNMYTTAGIPQMIQMSEPIVIPPGNGLTVAAPMINTDLPTNFEYYEETL
jgi:hypothetical protein